ncbi:uncharacterized protein LOC123682211 [Harmonia axyridis]|uniref:uncharacterized protein LOC123682211 n=1 Tax=Harmonia axyridis TaxID=115357 RepID=UPI001E2773A2|nr:uncharacterized protein LOC123682211 [Harmonia axyridis]
MAEDPVVNLLREHFKKVHECLQDKKNFDILTRFSFRSTSDKSIGDTDDEYTNPEFELSQRTPEKCLNIAFRPITEAPVESFDSEEFQTDTNFEECNTEKQSDSDACSSMLTSELDDYKQESIKSSRKTLLERPETPMLEMSDFEDENEFSVEKPKRMEYSRKFIHYPEQLIQTDDLNISTETTESNQETKMDRSEFLDILPKRDEPERKLNILTPEDNDSAFREELEMYKRDIKMEKTIKSLSYNNENLNLQTTSKIHHPSFSYDQCMKNVIHGHKTERMKEPRDFNLHNSFTLDVPQNREVPEYLKDYFEETKTNVCRKSSEYGQDDKKRSNLDNYRAESSVDNEILNLVKERILGNPSLNDEKDSSHFDNLKSSEEKFVAMNHFEIQQQMLKRIEDMYKPGDGK